MIVFFSCADSIPIGLAVKAFSLIDELIIVCSSPTWPTWIMHAAGMNVDGYP
jgi:hypothetical protein